MKNARKRLVIRSERGVALILVMLSLLVLSVLAASIIFTARSETFASFNYRISTQAAYVAKAGLQRGVNFFNSDKYKAVDPSTPSTTYSMSQYATTPVPLWNTQTRPVECLANCATANGAVMLRVDSGGTFNGNYPTNLLNPDSQTVPTAFVNRLYNIALDPLSNANNSGQFTVEAQLLEYFTVNDAFYPTINRKPYEVWRIVSTGTWNSNLGAGTRKTTSVQEAIIAPIYLPYFANALYGMCNLTLNGQVCTDSYNSNGGSYNGTDPADCVEAGETGSNSFASGAGVGSGGNVMLNGGSYLVNGDVSYGSSPPTYSNPWSCPSASSGVSGSTGGVTGNVQPVPAIPQPPMPTFPSGCTQYGGGTSCPAIPGDANLGIGESVWIRQIPPTTGAWNYTLGTKKTTTDTPLTGAGTFADPYRLPEFDLGNGASLCIAGGNDAASAIHYDLVDLATVGGMIYIVNKDTPPTACPPQAGYNSFGYVVLNIYEEMSLGGQGVVQYGAPAPSLVINIYNEGSNDTSDVSLNLNGQANLTAMVTALGGATLGGGGTGGAMYGAILAGSITDSGTYPVHYDMALQVASGKLMPMAIRNYSRPKY